MDRDGPYAVGTAAGQGHKLTMLLLLEHRTNVNVKDDSGQTSLHYALTSTGFSEALAILLIEKGASVHERGHREESVLTLAASRGSPAFLRKLIDLGARVNEADIDGNTPLHKAAEYGNREAVILLLEEGARIHAMNDNGAKPVDQAQRWTSNDATRNLLKSRMS